SMAGGIKLEVDGDLTVDPSAATIAAFAGTGAAVSYVASESGQAGNDFSVFFDFEPDSSVIAPVATYNAAGRQLTVYVRNGESTVGQVLAAINAVSAFPMTAVLASGPFDGSATFTADLTEETVFVASGGSESGIVAGA